MIVKVLNERIGKFLFWTILSNTLSILDMFFFHIPSLFAWSHVIRSKYLIRRGFLSPIADRFHWTNRDHITVLNQSSIMTVGEAAWREAEEKSRSPLYLWGCFGFLWMPFPIWAFYRNTHKAYKMNKYHQIHSYIKV